MPPPTVREIVDMVKKYYPDARINFKPDPSAAAGLKTIPRIVRGDRQGDISLGNREDGIALVT